MSQKLQGDVDEWLVYGDYVWRLLFSMVNKIISIIKISIVFI